MREIGYYWVHMGSQWVIQLFHNQIWNDFDTEETFTDLMYDEIGEKVERYDSFKNDLYEAIKALGVKYPDGKLCFCEMAIGNPMMYDHSKECRYAREAIEKMEGRNGIVGRATNEMVKDTFTTQGDYKQ